MNIRKYYFTIPHAMRFNFCSISCDFAIVFYLADQFLRCGPGFCLRVQLIANVLCSHSGGEEVLLDVGGQDATEAFEDVGHSDEARETLEQLLVGTLKRKVRIRIPKILDLLFPIELRHADGLLDTAR